MQRVSLPTLSDDQWQKLNPPITLEEAQKTASSFPNCQALGDNVLPIETYKHCAESVLLHLLEVFNASLVGQHLQSSMCRANIILLIKPGKDRIDPGSYRPISLLQRDAKILAKVFAFRLN